MTLNANEAMILLAEGVLGIYLLLPWTDPDSRKYVIGIFGGLVIGHINGRVSVREKRPA